MSGDVDGLILAGGQGVRFGGRNKALITWQGASLLEHVATRLGPQVERLMVSANEDLARIAAVVSPVLPDDPDLGAGPLAGVVSGLAHSRAEWLATVPTDMPLIPSNLIEHMMNSLKDGAKLAVAHDGNRRQNCVLLVHQTLQSSVEVYLHQGRRSVAGWLRQTAHREVSFPSSAVAFSNLNSEADLDQLAAAQQQMSKSG